MEDWKKEAQIPTNIGPYQVLGTLGTGSFSIVRLGFDPESKMYYAIKIVPKICIIERGLESKFENEIRIVQQLRHPGVVQLIDLLQDDINYYLVMEYCSNGDLYTLITHGTTISTIPVNNNNSTRARSNVINSSNNPSANSNSSAQNVTEVHHLSETEAKSYFRQIADTLIYVHKQGVAHRDLKPENILIDSYGRLKLSDFGLSRFVGTDGLARTPCGSPCYAAPEIIRSGVDMSIAGSYSCYDGRKSDAWSCGVILYAMLTGFLPWTRYRNQASLFQQILDGDFVIPEYVPVQAAFLIRMLMEVIPEQRFSVQDALASEWMKSTVPMLSTMSNNLNKNITVNSASTSASSNSNSISPPVVMIGQHGFSMNDIPKFGDNKFGVPANENDHNKVVYESGRGAVSLRTVDRFFNRDSTDDENMFQSVESEKESLWRSSSASSRTIEGVMKAISTNKKLHMMHTIKHRHTSLASASVLPSSSSKKNDASLSSSSSSSTIKLRTNVACSTFNPSDAITVSSTSSSSNSAQPSSISTPKGAKSFIDQQIENEKLKETEFTKIKINSEALSIHHFSESTNPTPLITNPNPNTVSFSSHTNTINSNQHINNSHLSTHSPNTNSLKQNHNISISNSCFNSNSNQFKPNGNSLAGSSSFANCFNSHLPPNSTDINSNAPTALSHPANSPMATNSMSKINSLHVQHSTCNPGGGVIKKASVIANQPVIVSPGAQRQIKPVSFIP